jgi:hypothetical protein
MSSCRVVYAETRDKVSMSIQVWRAGDIATRLTKSSLRQKCLVVQQVSMSSSKSSFLSVQVRQRCWVD